MSARRVVHVDEALPAGGGGRGGGRQHRVLLGHPGGAQQLLADRRERQHLRDSATYVTFPSEHHVER